MKDAAIDKLVGSMCRKMMARRFEMQRRTHLRRDALAIVAFRYNHPGRVGISKKGSVWTKKGDLCFAVVKWLNEHGGGWKAVRLWRGIFVGFESAEKAAAFRARWQ